MDHLERGQVLSCRACTLPSSIRDKTRRTLSFEYLANWATETSAGTTTGLPGFNSMDPSGRSSRMKGAKVSSPDWPARPREQRARGFFVGLGRRLVMQF